MGIQIADKEAEALVAELESLTGKSQAEVVLEALRKSVAECRHQSEIDAKLREIDEITTRYAARLPPNPPTPDEIIGYDENGLPR